MSREEIIEKALELPDKDRAMIAERLIGSLDDVTLDASIELAWQNEIGQRMEQVDNGEVTCEPWEAVRDRITEKLGDQR